MNPSREQEIIMQGTTAIRAAATSLQQHGLTLPAVLLVVGDPVTRELRTVFAAMPGANIVTQDGQTLEASEFIERLRGMVDRVVAPAQPIVLSRGGVS